jgi:hypothetical protein
VVTIGVVALVSGVIIHLITYLSLKSNAHTLPGGAFASGVALSLLYSPWYVIIPCALAGHFLSVYCVKRYASQPDSQLR